MRLIQKTNLNLASYTPIRLFALIAILLLPGLSVLQAAELPPQGSSRVYIQINGNQKDLVVNNIKRGGGNVHYEFERLNAVAATFTMNLNA